MKKIILLICILFTISGCATKSKEEASIDVDARLGEGIFNIEKTNNCNNKITEYYESNNKKIYFSCLNEVKIEYKASNESLTLSYILNDNGQDFDNTFGKLIQAFFKEYDVYKDGGTKMYKNDKATVIVCHQLLEEGKYNEDIYIGDEKLEYKDDFCNRK